MSDTLSLEELNEYDKILNELAPKKKFFIKQMMEAFGNVSQAARLCGISRFTYYAWLREDVLFAKLIKEGQFDEMLLDFAELKLVENINKRDVASVIFFLKTKGKHRGYVERQAIAGELDLDKAPSWFKQTEIPEGYNSQQLPSAIAEAEIISESKIQPNE